MPASDASGVIVLACAVLLVGAAAMPAVGLLSDADASGNNPVTGAVVASTLDETGPASRESTTDERDPATVSDTWEDTAHPTDGSAAVENTLTVDAGPATADSDTVAVVVSFVENDTGTASTDGNGEQTAKSVQVTEFAYNGSDVLSTKLTDLNGNGNVDVEDLTNGSNADELATLGGVSAGSTADIDMTLSGSSTLLDTGDGIDITVAVRTEASSYTDTDRSVNNTVIYDAT